MNDCNYEYIKICAKIAPIAETMTKRHADGILREAAIANKAPEMLRLLKRSQKALLMSKPIDQSTEAMNKHVNLHNELCEILMLLNELQ